MSFYNAERNPQPILSVPWSSRNTALGDFLTEVKLIQSEDWRTIGCLVEKNQDEDIYVECELSTSEGKKITIEFQSRELATDINTYTPVSSSHANLQESDRFLQKLFA